MILKRYCIDCGKIEPPKDEKCCPDSRVFWVEKDAAERINDMERGRLKTFEGILRERDQLLARVAEHDAGHPEWMKRIQQERQAERERLWEAMKMHWRGDMGPAHIIVNEVEHLFKP